MRGIITLPVAGFVLLILLYIATVFGFVWTYNALTYEEPIAIVTFGDYNKTSQTHTMHLKDDDGNFIGDYKIYGDQWRIDARFVKMKNWANILGMDSRYALDRVEGRYENVEDQNNKKNVAYDLGKDDHDLVFGSGFFVDTEFGTSVYKEIDPKMVYTVYKTQSAMIVRSQPIQTTKEKDFLEKTKNFLGFGEEEQIVESNETTPTTSE